MLGFLVLARVLLLTSSRSDGPLHTTTNSTMSTSYRPSFSLKPVKVSPSLFSSEQSSVLTSVANVTSSSYIATLSSGELVRITESAVTKLKFQTDTGGSTSIGGLLTGAGGAGSSTTSTVQSPQLFGGNRNSSGSGVIVATATGDNYYVYSPLKDVAAVAVPRLKGYVVTCAGVLTASADTNWIIGTQNGKLLFLSLDGAIKKEKSFRLVAELPERVVDIISLDSSRIVACTPSCMYQVDQATGKTDLLLESPVGSLSSRLHVENNRCVSWLCGVAIVVHKGELAGHPSVGPHTCSMGIPNEGLVSARQNPSAQPKNGVFYVTPFHYVFVLEDKLMFVNRVRLGEPAVASIATAPYGGALKQVVGDGAMELFSERRIYSLVITNEQGDEWKHYLKQGNFLAAANFANNAVQKSIVYKAEADYCLASPDEGLSSKAAELYARAVSTSQRTMAPYINEIIANLLGSKGGEGKKQLLKFLLAKLDMIGKGDEYLNVSDSVVQVQVSVLFLYIAELFIDLMVKETMDHNNTGETSTEAMFYSFVSDSYASLHIECIKTVYELLRASGLFNSLIVVAETVGDIQTAVQTEIILGNYLNIINRIAYVTGPQLSKQLEDSFIQVSSILFRYHPNELIDAMIKQRKYFSPYRLIVPVISFAGALTQTHKDAAIRYIDLVFDTAQDVSVERRDLDGDLQLFRIQSELIAASKCTPGNEDQFIQFIDARKHEPFCDMDFLVRTVKCHNLELSQLALLSISGMHLLAVKGALKLKSVPGGNVELAIRYARRTPENPKHVRRLCWLEILKQESRTVSKLDINQRYVLTLIQLFKESNGSITLTDLMTVMESIGITTIETIHEEIVQEINRLQEETSQTTKDIQNYSESLQLIQSDMSKKVAACIVLSHSQKCELCLKLVYSEKFVVFDSCGHCFHTECLKEALCMRLINVPNSDELILRDCCLCGDNSLLVEAIFQPFVDPRIDKTELDFWSIKTS